MVRITAANSLRAVEPLVKALLEGGMWTVKYAAYALRKIDDPRAIELLIKAWLEGDIETRAHAGLALREIGQGAVGKKARQDKDSNVRKAAKATSKIIDDYSGRTIFEINAKAALERFQNAKAALERICRGIEGKGRR